MKTCNWIKAQQRFVCLFKIAGPIITEDETHQTGAFTNHQRVEPLYDSCTSYDMCSDFQHTTMSSGWFGT